MPHLPFNELPDASPGRPTEQTARKYLTWLARRQGGMLAANATFGVGWMIAQALMWAAVGAAIDHGVAHADTAALVLWVGVVFGLGLIQAVFGALRHQLAVTNWMRAAYRTVQVVGHHVAETGTAVTSEVPSGDIVNTVASDAMRIGGAFDVLARFMGAIASWIVVSFILLSTSVELGLIVLIGVPVLAAATSPLMRPLHRTQAAQRDEAGHLAALASDTVSGLRILRGVGGEGVFFENYARQSQRVRATGVQIATPQAGLESGQILLPGILTAIVTYLGARDVMAGTLQVGQLVAFFGYATFLTTPLRTAIEYVISTTRAYVGAGRVVRILSTRSPISDTQDPLTWPTSPGELRDPQSGISLHPGELLALVTATPDEAARLCDRLGRLDPSGDTVVLDEVPLAKYSVSDLRQHIVVNEIEPRLFSGVLREELSPHGDHGDDSILHALYHASAHDVLDTLEAGLESQVEERGRSFSGGQRQRLALARALLTRADYLLLVEPTSAVDTHTEGRIAARLREARVGRATLIATTSPLILERVDRVLFVENETILGEGSHEELLNQSPQYRRVVLRSEE